jgi:chromosomal replication initiator protein
MNIWDQILERLQLKLSQQTFENWLANTSFLYLEQSSLYVSVPDRETGAWLEAELAAPVLESLRELRLPVERVCYRPQPPRGNLNRAHAALEPIVPASTTETPSLPAASSGMPSVVPSLPDGDSLASALNPKFSFETFVVGSCNRFAHAAARSVADHPARSYNPLFLYGGVGMGKTHLMHAIGRELMDRYATLRIVYTSSEKFMNEMISCIRTERMPQFHQRYRAADVLLIDDIQLLGNKERTQEEFFHTFNELHDHQKQIVVSSDAHPKEIPGLLERLRSRFEWGLLADIQPPDLETKMAILDKKAEAEGVALPDDVRIFIASKTKSNVRELEGALIKLVAYSSLTGAPIHIGMAQQILKNLTHGRDPKISIDAIQKAVAERMGIKQSQLKEKSNTRKVVYPRQVAMYLVKELTDASLPEIGRAFGGKHHTTVMHSINKIEKDRHNDPELNRLIHSLMDSLQ